MMLEKYDEAKRVIFEVVQRLREDKELLFPVRIGASELHDDYLDDIIDAIDKDKFLVSVCGQIKAGKSTLLNALLFHRPLLPTKVTPETATLTKISYGESFNAHVTFCSSDDWSRLIERNAFVESHDEQFSIMKEAGIDPDDYLNTSINENDESNLGKYISADAPLTLLVKQLEIEHPSVPHKGLVFVDTPGLNDPNIVRSQITIDWVSKSDAVLFVLHSRGVDKNDYTFMDESMAGIQENSFILVLNRCDELDSVGLERVKDYILDSLSTGSIAQKELISSKTSIIPISARAAFFNRADEELLEENDLWHLEKMRDDNPDLISSDGYFTVLENAISEKLIDNKGRNIIRTNANKLNRLLSSKHHFIQMEIERLNTQIEQLSSSAQDIEERIRQHTYRKKMVNASFRPIMNKFEVEANESQNKLFKIVDEAFIEIEREIRQFVLSEESPGRIASVLPWKLRISLRERLFHGSKLKATIEAISTQMDDAVNIAKDGLTKALAKEYPGLLKFIGYSFSLKSLSDSIDVNLSKATYENFRECIERVLGFLWVRSDKSRENLAEKVRKLLLTVADGIHDGLKNEVFAGVKQMKVDIETEVDHFLHRISEDLIRERDEKKTNKESGAEYKKKLEKLSVDERKLDQIRDRESAELCRLFEAF